jgi:hypothetical protein
VASGGCFDLGSSNQHCGSCAKACAANEECRSSLCVPTSCSPACERGNSCDVAQNKCLCNGGAACLSPNFCCASGCTNRLSDPLNCSVCGNNVSPNLCCGGVPTPHTTSNCSACGASCACGELCCNGLEGWKCIAQDGKHCGGCNSVCPLSGNLPPVCCPGCCCDDPMFCSAGTCPDLVCPASLCGSTR